MSTGSGEAAANASIPSIHSSKLLVIVGPTASGKSDLAMKLAKKLDGEIICADSRTVYKGLDIGTAKPTQEDQHEVNHHLLDVVEPDQSFTVADFKILAERAIDDIRSRNKLPIMVGGSGLYIDAVLYDYKFTEGDSARDISNTRHLSKNVPRRRSELRDDAVIVGISIDRQLLKQRITKRIDGMLEGEFLREVETIQRLYPSSKALLATGYKAFIEYINGRIDIEEAKALFIKNDHNLAKRQMTWFKRNKKIHWLTDANTYEIDTIKLLNNLH